MALPAGSGARFSPRNERLSFAIGPVDAAQLSIVASPRAKGYVARFGSRVVQYTSRRGAKPVVRISLDARNGRFKLTASKFNFPAVPTTDLEFTCIAGDDGFADRRTWVDEGAGRFRVVTE